LLQRRLRIGYPRAARLIDELEDLGIVGPSQGSGKDREVLTAYDQEDDEINNL
jgi:S-DNA-T family DNA segregation ATPase FtsK/SpoIIIE